MEKNMPGREIDDTESKEITLDFEDATAQPVDGVIVQGDNGEIKLLFFYLKPESNHDEDGYCYVLGAGACWSLGRHWTVRAGFQGEHALTDEFPERLVLPGGEEFTTGSVFDDSTHMFKLAVGLEYWF